MFVIFDLDNTLLDTKQSFFLHRLQHFFHEHKISHSLLGNLSKHSHSSNEAFDEASDLSLNEALVTEIRDFCSESYYKNFALLPGARDVLHFLLQKKISMALVTKGEKNLQRQKIAALGELVDLFSEIHIVEQNSKLPAYQKILRKQGLDPKMTVVIGDKIDVDLLPARGLGCFTIHVDRKNEELLVQKKIRVDYTINQLIDVIEILEKIRWHDTMEKL